MRDRHILRMHSATNGKMAQTHAIKNAIQKEVHQCSSTQNVEETADVFLFSFIRTMTVGSGISPDLLTSTNRALAAHSKEYTAGGEFRPALRTLNPTNMVRSKKLRHSNEWSE